jgi:lysophospholipase L1-like esterase
MKINSFPFVVATCLGLCVSFCQGQITKIEAFGDSLTAGFLSNTRVVQASPLFEVSRIVSDLAAYRFFHDTKFLKQHQDPTWAWPQRLAERIAPEGEKIEVRNYAVSGAFTRDLLTQVSNAPKAVQGTWSFFLIGHNDLCGNHATPDSIAETFKSLYRKALAAWDQNHQGAVGFLVPVGAIYRVYQALDGYVWHQSSKGALSCRDSWRPYFPYCPSYAHLQANHQLEAFLAPKIEAMNHALGDLVDEWNKKSSRNRFLYLSGVHDKSYEPKYFAVDCFHLSPEGQEELSKSVQETIERLM